LFPHETEVHEAHQRKGIASAMYDLAEKHAGLDLQPSVHDQSEDAQALWEHRLDKSFLAKSPIKYEGEVFNHPQKVKTSEEKPFVNRKTTQALPNGLTHKILHGDQKTIHELYDKDKLVGALTVVNNQVRDSQVSSEEQGRNYGKSLYSAALRHHGQLESDTLVSPAAAHQWQRLGAMNNVDYRPAPYLTNEEYSNWINEGMNPDSPHEPFKAQVTGQLDDKEAFP